IDVALYESVFSIMEGMLPEYDKTGFIRERTGTSLPGVAPSNTYLCKDGKYIVIGGNGDSIFKRFMYAMSRKDLADNPKFASNKGRAEHSDYLDKQIEDWTKTLDFEVVLKKLDDAGVPAGAIYNIEDIVNDAQYNARGMIQEFKLNDEEDIKIPGIIPKM